MFGRRRRHAPTCAQAGARYVSCQFRDTPSSRTRASRRAWRSGRRPLPPGVPMKSLAFVALAVAGICWGLGFPTGKLILTETDAAHMVLLRFAVAALAAAPFALRRPEVRVLFRSPIVLLSGVLYGIAFMVQFEGLAHVSVTVAAL